MSRVRETIDAEQDATFADAEDGEADLGQRGVIQNVATVKDKLSGGVSAANKRSNTK